MANVKLDTVRSGVQLLSGLAKRADEENDDNGKLSKAEIKNFKDAYGDGASMDAALDKMFKYTQRKYDTTTPTVKQFNTALSDAMKGAAKADTNHNGLSAAERRTLAETWESVVEFSNDYKGMSVDDIVNNDATP